MIDSIEQDIAASVDASVDEAVDFLERTVNVNSGTHNPEGVLKVADLYIEELERLKLDPRWIGQSQVNRGGHVVAEHEGAGGTRVLLIGHIDTVFEPSSAFQQFVRQGTRATGPGVVDMKGGNTVILYALRALADVGKLGDLAVRVFFAGDEEDTGVPYDVSRSELFEVAKRSDVALGFEPAFGGGIDKVTVARRGIGRWTVEVDGKVGHSSQVFGDELGFGAAYEVARVVDGFRRALSDEDYLTLNPGLMMAGNALDIAEGGNAASLEGKMNIIARAAVAKGDIRFLTPEQEQRARQRMQDVVAQGLPQTSAQLTFGATHPPMPPQPGNDRLLEILDSVSRDLGDGPLTALDPGLRGAADISFVSEFVPGLCGLGAAGGGCHAEDEWIDLSSFPKVITRTALMLYRLSSTEPAVFQKD